MNTPEALLERLRTSAGMEAGRRRLVVLMTQLGDFDSLEYAQALAPALPQLEKAGIQTLAIAIGDEQGAQRFCNFTGFPRVNMELEPEAELHRRLGLYEGLRTVGGPWPGLLLMCAGIGSPGTLSEVLRGYTGDRNAAQRIDSPLFRLAGGEGFQRPFELATVRLRNMSEVLSNWRTYVPRDDFINQRGGTYLLDADDRLLYSHRDPGILGFSATMHRPLNFLEPFLQESA